LRGRRRQQGLLYYYFQGKDALYTAALESVAQGVRDSSLAVFDADASPASAFCYRRSTTSTAFTPQGIPEPDAAGDGAPAPRRNQRPHPLAETVFKPLMTRMMQVLREGIASGELIPVDPSQIRLAASEPMSSTFSPRR